MDKQEQSHDAIILYLPKSTTADSFLRQLRKHGDTGPILSFGKPEEAGTEFQDLFSIWVQPEKRDSAILLLDKWKKEGRISLFSARGYHFQIRAEEGWKESIELLIDDLLKNRLVLQPADAAVFV